MYLRILKKDLQRKKTMNAILLIFVILAATFIASSANNLITVSSALDNFYEKAEGPDYWFVSTNADDVEQFQTFAQENGYDYKVSELIQYESVWKITMCCKSVVCSDFSFYKCFNDALADPR